MKNEIGPDQIGDDTLLSLDEAAKILLRGLVKAATLRNAITRGELSYTRLGRRIVVQRRDVEEWRAWCRVAAKRTTADGSASTDALRGAPSLAPSSTEEAQAALSAAVASLKNLHSLPNRRGAAKRRGGL